MKTTSIFTPSKQVEAAAEKTVTSFVPKENKWMVKVFHCFYHHTAAFSPLYILHQKCPIFHHFGLLIHPIVLVHNTHPQDEESSVYYASKSEYSQCSCMKRVYLP